MKVKEFLDYALSNMDYHVVDATKQGYLSEPEKNVIYGGDRNVINDLYSNNEVIGFEPRTKKSIYLYIKPEIKESTFMDSVLRHLKEGRTRKVRGGIR